MDSMEKPSSSEDQVPVVFKFTQSSAPEITQDSAPDKEDSSTEGALKIHFPFPSESSPQPASKIKREKVTRVEGAESPTQKKTEAVTTTQLASSASSQAVEHASSSQTQPARQERPAWNSFEHVTRNQPSRQASIADHGRDAEVDALCRHLAQGDWQGILDVYRRIDPDILESDALKAFSQGKIIMEQYSTLAYLAALLKESPGIEIQIQPLFDQAGNINETAQRLVEFGVYNSEFFTPEETQDFVISFFNNMKNNKPISEQFCFYLPHQGEGRGIDPSIREILDGLIGFRLFDRFFLQDVNPRTCLMMPSFSMMQAAVDVYGKENAVTIWPTTGLSTRANMRDNIENNSRDFFVPSQGVICPATADGFRVVGTKAFGLHDFYHCMTCSKVPQPLRQEVGRLADMVSSLQAQNINDQDEFFMPFLETVYGRMVDMDFMFFRPGWRSELAQAVPEIQNATQSELFLLELEHQVLQVTAQRMLLKLNTLPPQDKRQGLPEATLASLRRWDKIKERIDGGEAFAEIFKEFCTTHGGFKKLADAIYNSGLLDRQHISQENLNHIRELSSRVGGQDPFVAFMPALGELSSPLTDHFALRRHRQSNQNL